jgi:hypothetical protein
MAENKSYQFGPVLTDRIINVVKRVDGMPYQAGLSRIPTRFEDEGGGGGSRIRIGKTTATWAKNTLATITLYESGTPPNETTGSPTQTLEGCVNKWGDVQANKWVGLQRGATGPYYLVVAEC